MCKTNRTVQPSKWTLLYPLGSAITMRYCKQKSMVSLYSYLSGDLIPEKRKTNSVTALQPLLLSQNQPCSVVSICMAKHIDEPGDENRRKR